MTITVRNEFETIPAWTRIAGSSHETWTDREITCEMIKVLSEVTSRTNICNEFWKQVAEEPDSVASESRLAIHSARESKNPDHWIEIQDAVADEITLHLPAYCYLTMKNNEWQVIPFIDKCLTQLDETPETYQDDHILVVNDHGNITCMEWDFGAEKYIPIWNMT